MQRKALKRLDQNCARKLLAAASPISVSVFAAVHNRATKIDSTLAPGLDLLPGFSGLMAMLASRNLLRGMALGLPSGQGMAVTLASQP